MKASMLFLSAGLCLAGLIGCDQTKAPAPTAVTVTVQDPVHVTRTGKAYHHDGCRYLDASDFVESRQDAVQHGLAPCSICYPQQAVPKIEMVHVAKTGKVFHKDGCQYLKNLKKETVEPRSEAIRQGLKPCSVCGG